MTEDPAFAAEVRDGLGPDAFVATCLGPGQGHCLMEERGSCGLASRADFVLVDVPAGGAFYDHYRGMPAITYAGRLAEIHPSTDVILCSADESGGRRAFLTRPDAIAFITSNEAEKRGEDDDG